MSGEDQAVPRAVDTPGEAAPPAGDTGGPDVGANPSAQPSAAGEAGEPQWHRLHPLTVWTSVVVLAALIFLPAVVTAVVVAIAGHFLPWGALILPAAALVVAALAGIDVLRLRLTRYRATDERMEMYSGILSRNYRSIPRERIRSVDVNVPLWARLFGLCQVSVGTGQNVEAGGDELKLEYVAAREGERLRLELLRRGAPGTAAGGVAEDAATADGSGTDTAKRADAGSAELIRLNPAWLGYAAVAWYSGALGVGAVSGAYTVVSWFDQEQANQAAVEVYQYLIANALLAIPGFLLGVLVTGAVAALALQLEAWWAYRVTREPDDTLRVRRGLLNAKSLSIEERRMRGVKVGQPLPLRWLGAANVAAVATGLNTNASSGSSVAKSALSPDMPHKAALNLTASVLREQAPPTAAPLAAHPRAALRRRLNRAAAGVLAIAAAAGAAVWLVDFVPVWTAVVAVLVAAALLVPYAVGCYQGLGHAVSGRYVLVRKGMAARATVALRRDAVIGWTVSRSPFQRRLGLATVSATTAAGTGAYSALDVDLSEGLAFADEAVPELLAPFLERS